MTNRKLPHVEEGRPLCVPDEIMKKHKNISLGLDVMHINQAKFLVGVSREIKFGIANFIPDRKQDTMIEAIRQQCNVYERRGFHVTNAYMDSEFKDLEERMNNDDERFLRADSEEYVKNTTEPSIESSGKGEHVPEPERMIRTIKDSVRCTRASMRLVKRFPLLLIIEMVAAALLWYNFSIPVGGVSSTIPPYTIMTGKVLDVKRDCKHRFGEYVHVPANVDPKKSNDTRVRRSV